MQTSVARKNNNDSLKEAEDAASVTFAKIRRKSGRGSRGCVTEERNRRGDFGRGTICLSLQRPFPLHFGHLEGSQWRWFCPLSQSRPGFWAAEAMFPRLHRSTIFTPRLAVGHSHLAIQGVCLYFIQVSHCFSFCCIDKEPTLLNHLLFHLIDLPN